LQWKAPEAEHQRFESPGQWMQPKFHLTALTRLLEQALLKRV
jgi:hypothetical protein